MFLWTHCIDGDRERRVNDVDLRMRGRDDGRVGRTPDLRRRGHTIEQLRGQTAHPAGYPRPRSLRWWLCHDLLLERHDRTAESCHAFASQHPRAAHHLMVSFILSTKRAWFTKLCCKIYYTICLKRERETVAFSKFFCLSENVSFIKKKLFLKYQIWGWKCFL